MMFRAWYDDGQVYAGGIDEWKAMPKRGVVVVVLYRPTGRTLYTSADWYWLEGEQVHRVMSGPWGTDQPKPKGVCLDCLKEGVGVSDETFDMMYAEALRGD